MSSGFTTPKQIDVFGMSNGGLLSATLGTQRPDMFGAVVNDLPLTDRIRMRHMGMGAAWINEYGDPDKPDEARVMLAYSPMQNVRKGTTYPPFLVTVSTETTASAPVTRASSRRACSIPVRRSTSSRTRKAVMASAMRSAIRN